MNLEIVITDVVHFTGARHTRTTYYAFLRDQATGNRLEDCGHREHRTIKTAKACGIRMYKAHTTAA